MTRLHSLCLRALFVGCLWTISALNMPRDVKVYEDCCSDDFRTKKSDCVIRGAFRRKSNVGLVSKQDLLLFPMDRNGLPDLGRIYVKKVGDAPLKWNTNNEILDVFNFKDEIYFIWRTGESAFQTTVYNMNFEQRPSETLEFHRNLPNGTFPLNTLNLGGSLEQTFVACGTYSTSGLVQLTSIERYTNGGKKSSKSASEYQTSASFHFTDENGQYRYYTIHETGWTCKIRRPYDSQEIAYDYPDKGSGDILPQCFRKEIFFGCPQSFCYNHEVDDIITEKRDENKNVIIFRGYYYWTLEEKQLPLAMPQTSNAKPIHELSHAMDYGNIDAAEAYQTDKGSVMVFLKDDTVTFIVNGTRKHLRKWNVFSKIKKSQQVEAFWFDIDANTFAVFYEDKLQKYTTKDGVKFEFQSEEFVVKELPGVETKIEAVYQPLTETEKVTFISDKWYYTKNQESKEFKQNINLDFKSPLFNTYTENCGYKDKAEAEKVFQEVIKPKLDEYLRQVRLPTDPTTTTAENGSFDSEAHKDKNDSGVNYLLIILIVVASIFLIVAIAISVTLFVKLKKGRAPATLSTDNKQATKPKTRTKSDTIRGKSADVKSTKLSSPSFDKRWSKERPKSRSIGGKSVGIRPAKSSSPRFNKR